MFRVGLVTVRKPMEVGTVMKKLILSIVAAGMLAVAGFGYAAAHGLAPAPAQAVTQAAPASAQPQTQAALAPAQTSSTQQVGTETATGTEAIATGAEVSDPTEATAEKATAEEPGDANLPGGGHQDTEGTNVDHQFEGVE